MRIASVPSGHPYVEAILPDEVRLPDPTPPGQTPGDGVWWPPVVVDADWITRHASEIDLVHLHFGFESFSTEHLSAWLGALDAAGLPLVQTVHDLENPHLQDQEPHRRALDLLVPRAAAVLTLTDTAADVVAQSWGVQAEVVPHPQVVPTAWFARADALRAQREPGRHRPRIGLHLGAIRAGTDPTPWLAALAAAGADLDGEVVVRLNDEVLSATDDHRRRVLGVVQELAADGSIELQVGPRQGDDELHTFVAGLDVAVLPYRAGTHSGWLEMCWDLGTSVLVPGVGAIADQHRDDTFRRSFSGAADVDAALAALLEARSVAGSECPWGDAVVRGEARRAQLAQVRATHARVYEQVLGRHP
ncbi:glycosyltransferase [Arsenicicoccus piscis]|uniref:glycosyltransferase n=1 Tax=Arsenicicoccus piscis TaxID=673954 RepID=UPI001F4D31B3|nr:glycosyltransferase [Arsenicicoccus piscis]MCH8626459.1 glycosyltransferase [Arsenicicoccus piscis]